MKLAQKLPGYGDVESVPGFSSTFGTFKFKNWNIGDLISELLPYVLVIAGLLMGFFLISGGFELLTSGGDVKKIEAGQKRITKAIIGFLIIFLAYWLAQILETILGISILR